MDEQVMAILEEICGAEPGELEADTELFEDGILDSFGLISLFVEIEKKLGITLDPAELSREQLATPALILEQVRSRA